MPDNVKEFLKELTELCDKYNIYIKGCGCCGSPWLEDLNGTNYDNLTYSEGGYKVDD